MKQKQRQQIKNKQKKIESDLISNISIIILNVKGLNTLIKRQRLSWWIFKNELLICCPWEIYFKFNDVGILRVKWEKKTGTNINKKKAVVSILILYQYINYTSEPRQLPETLHTESLIHTPRRYINHKCIYTKHCSWYYVKQKLIELKGKVDKLLIIVGNFSMPLSAIDRTMRQKYQEGYRWSHRVHLTFIEHFTQNKRIHLFKWLWNLYHDRPYLGS